MECYTLSKITTKKQRRKIIVKIIKKATKKISGKKLKVPDGSNNKAAKPNFIIETTPEFICWTGNQNNGD